MGKGVATKVPEMSHTAIWALNVQNCILLLRATPAQQQQNVVKNEIQILLSLNLNRLVIFSRQMLSDRVLEFPRTALEPTQQTAFRREGAAFLEGLRFSAGCRKVECPLWVT